MKKIMLLALALAVPMLIHASDVSVTTLRTEQLNNPIGIDTAAPRLGWQIVSDANNVMQTAYRILVASTPEILAGDEGDLWDSGKVSSDRSQWVPYEGKKLASNEKVYWKVKSYTTAGESDWSEPAFWSVGLLKESQWSGIWIGMDHYAPWDNEAERRVSARYVRKEFPVTKEVKRATLHIAGLGLYELYLNGEKVGDQVLAPAPTFYTKTIIYNSFDVTDLLASDNAIGVALGNGHYYTTRRSIYGVEWVNFGFPKVRLNLIIEYEDGTSETIATDPSWKFTADGPIRANNEYDGEIYDARKEFGAWTGVGFDDSEWHRAERADNPQGTLRGAMAPNMKVIRTLSPVTVTQLGDKYILDMGQNSTGWLRIKVKGEEGHEITLRYAETLQENGELYTANLRSAKATDTYICNGHEDGVTWTPTFTYHGYRYVEVSGYPDAQPSDFVGEVVSDEMEITGSFVSSNETLNQVYSNATWGVLSNYKGIPMDCPQRDERQGWLGDRDVSSWGESYVQGNGPFYSKWMRDIAESQREDGCIPDVAPAFWYTTYTDNITWPYAFPSVCDLLYTQYGNPQAIQKYYPNIRLWLSHLLEEYMNEDLILTKDTYGDWCVPPESLELIHSQDPTRVTDGTLIATAYVVKVARLLERFATVLGLDDDAREYADLAVRVTDAFNAKFLHVGDEVYYGNNTVTANLLPLAFGMIPEEYEEGIARSLEHTVMVTYGGHVSCGLIGMEWLLRGLTQAGHPEIAWLLATNTTYPSWGYMASQGATTIWELWNGNTADPAMNSGNHVMIIGDFVIWCYEYVGGIRPDHTIGRTGFKHIIFQPEFEKGADFADVSYNSVYGRIESNWKKTDKAIDWEVTVPANTTAEVHFPDGTVQLIGSGHYTYRIDR